MSKYSFLNDQLSKRTSIFGLRLWVVLGVCVGAAIVLVLFLISLWFTSKRNKTNKNAAHYKFMSSLNNPTIPSVSKEIQEISVDPSHPTPDAKPMSPEPVPESDPVLLLQNEENTSPVGGRNRIHIEIRKDHRISYGSGYGSGETQSGPRFGDQGGTVMIVLEVSYLGWGHWYTRRELEVSTNGFTDENVIGDLRRGQAEKEFKVEVEAKGWVRHTNLARLLGYCAGGVHRSIHTDTTETLFMSGDHLILLGAQVDKIAK